MSIKISRMFYDLIIIGGGPAGITAGIYAARKRLKTLLLTKDFLGQVAKTHQIDNWPGAPGVLGLDLMKRLEEHLKKFEIDILEGEEVVKVDRSDKPALLEASKARSLTGSYGSARTYLVKTSLGKKFFAKTIIIATGSDPRPLDVPGEKEFIGRGVSYCFVCDAPFFKDKLVAVIGGGNAGFEAALDLAKYAKRIFIFERGNKIKADEILQLQAEKEKKIEVLLNKEIKKIEGRGKVQAIVYQDLNTGKTFQQPMDGVFVQIGLIPATGFLKGMVEFNEKDEIKVEPETGATSSPGIFAAGDVNVSKWKQIVIAAGEGCKAALAAYEYLKKR